MKGLSRYLELKTSTKYDMFKATVRNMTAANGHYVLNNMNLEHSNPQGGQFHLISEYGGKYRAPIYHNIPNLCGFSLWQTNIAVEATTHVVS